MTQKETTLKYLAKKLKLVNALIRWSTPKEFSALVKKRNALYETIEIIKS